MILWLLLPLCSGLAEALVARTTPSERWFNARVNHFMAYDNNTFPMRFYYNAEYANTAHAVIVLSDITHESPEWTRSGLANDLASGVGAGLFYTEHRYYGQSRLSGDTSLESLRYLTIDQALGDIAQLIQHIKSDDFEGGHYKSGKVVVLGCGYGGSLASWVGLAYPHLVAGAFSDCGPLEAREDLHEYLEVVTSAIQSRGGEECVSRIAEAFSALVALLGTAAGPATVTSLFNTCTTASPAALDTATMFATVQRALADAVMAPGAVGDACAVITEGDDPVQGLGNWVRTQDVAQPCLETRYTEIVATMSDDSYNNTLLNARLWLYQSCSQLGWFPTTGGERQPFLSTVPIEYHRQLCRDVFGTSANNQPLLNTERTNLMFGGRFAADGVTSAVGGHSPRSAVMVSKGRTLAPVHYLSEGGHCEVIRSISDNDPQEVQDTKTSVLNRLAIQLQGTPVYPSSAGRVAASFALIIAAVVILV